MVASIWSGTQIASTLARTNNNLSVNNTGATGNWGSVVGTNFLTSGNKYFEITINSRSGVVGAIDTIIGIGSPSINTTASGTDYVGFDTASLGAADNYNGTREIFFGNVTTAIGIGTFAVNTVLGVAVNIGSTLIWFTTDGANYYGASTTAGSPSGGTGGFNFSTLTGLASGIAPAASPVDDVASHQKYTLNTTGPFSYAIPSGFAPFDPVACSSMALLGVGCWAVAKKLEENPTLSRRSLILPRKSLIGHNGGPRLDD